MRTKVIKAAEKYGMLISGDTVIVGLSGGADSVALLFVMLSLREEFGISVRACHINHNLRGSESDADESYVRGLCERLGVPLDVISVDVKAGALKHESTEETARRLRYAAFSELCEKYGAKLATAHTASDNAETVLMNLIRGTGTKGMAGIPPVRGRIIRPLIFLTREDTEQICREAGLEYVTDSTNLSDDYTRNRIRHNLLPGFKEFNPSFIAGVTRMTSAIREDSDFLEELSREMAENAEKTANNGAPGYDSVLLSSLPRPILTRIIAARLKEADIEPDSLKIEECIGIIKAGVGKVNLKKDRFAMVRKKVFYIETQYQEYKNRKEPV